MTSFAVDVVAKTRQGSIFSPNAGSVLPTSFARTLPVVKTVVANPRRAPSDGAKTRASCAASPSRIPWAYPDLGAPFAQCIRAETGGTISYRNLQLEIPPGALDEDTVISVRPLTSDELGPLESQQTNVTPQRGGYRLGPIGMQFLAPVTLSLPFDSAAVPTEHDVQNIYALYFDRKQKAWVTVPKIAIKAGLVQSTTTHFTDFVAASIRPPDSPGPKVFAGSDLAAVQAPDPLAGLDLMAPAAPNASGSANFVLPIRVPPGRNGQQPNLAIQYNSDAGNGWLGVGWGLNVPSIDIATRFGVPRYDEDQELVYTLNGADLVDVTGDTGFFENRPQLRSTRDDVRQYARRVEGSFERILRVGDRPPYRWEVHRQDGSTQIFGEAGESRLGDPNEARDPDARTRVARWFLSKETDRFGNTMRYSYRRDEGCLELVRAQDASGTCKEYFTRIYPYRIEYSEHPGDAGTQGGASGSQSRLNPFYSVHFKNYKPIRKDIVLDARAGFVQATRKLLAGVEVRHFAAHQPATYSVLGLIRRYSLDYIEGDFGKSLLVTLGQQGPEEARKVKLDDPYGSSVTFASHALNYYLKRGPDPQMGYEPFSPAKRASGQEDKTQPQAMPGLSKPIALSAGESSQAGGGGYLGIRLINVDGRTFSGKSKVTQTMVDVHGDGLVDHVSDAFGLKKNINAHASDRYFDRWFSKADPSADDWGSFKSDGALGSTTGWGNTAHSSTSVKLNVRLPDIIGTGVSVGVTNSSSLDRFMLADMNGDGLVDRVSTTAEPGKLSVALGRPSGSFMAARVWGRQPQSAKFVVDNKFAAQLMAKRRIFEPVLRWTAPRAGTVMIDGIVRKLEEGGDGLTVQIHTKKGAQAHLLWSYALGATDLEPCRPSSDDGICGEGLEVQIEAGEAIYFRLSGHPTGNTDRKTSIEGDRISWHPSIRYLDQEPETRGPDGSSETTFDLAKDLRVTASRLVRWIATGKGEVRIWPEANKDATADDLRFEVIRENKEGTEIERKVQVIEGRRDGEVKLLVRELAVEPGDRILVQVSSDLPVDPDRVRVKADLFFESESATGAGELERVEVHHRLHKFLPHSRLSSLSRTRATFSVDFSQYEPQQLEQCVVAIQGAGRLLYKSTPTKEDPVVEIDERIVGEGPHYVTVVAPRNDNAAPQISDADVPVNLRYLDPAYHEQDEAPVDHFSGGYRGWQYADFDGISDFGPAIPWIDDYQALNDESVFVQALSSPLGLKSTKDNSSWNIRGGGRISLEAWSLGDSSALIPDPSDSGDAVIRLPVEGVQASRTRNYDFSAGVVIGGASVGVGRSYPAFTLMDINGDGRADGIGPEGVSYNLGRFRGFSPEKKMDLGFEPDFRLGQSQQIIAALGIDLGGSLQLISKVSGGGAFEGAGLSSFRSGTLYGFANTSSQMMDINGDGLVDQVRRHGSQDFEVRLGLGYRFAAPVIWPAHRWKRFRPGRTGELEPVEQAALGVAGNLAPHTVRVSETHTHNAGIDFSFILRFGRGEGSTLTRNLVDLVDMNGDGLPDAVLKNPEDSFLQVQLNDGTGFLPVQQWEVPDWPKQVFEQEGFRTHGLQDVLGYSWGHSKTTSAGLGFCPGKLCLGGGGSKSTGKDATQLALRDINGDGLVDHVFKPTKGKALWVKLNQLGRSNLLGSVLTPAGGTYEVDYAKRGNEIGEVRVKGTLRGFDSPKSRYVMRVQETHDDLHLNRPLSPNARTFYEYFYEVYDRIARVPNGFGLVKSFLSDHRGKAQIHTWDYHNEDYYRRGLLRSHTLSSLDVQGNEDWLSRVDYGYSVPDFRSQGVEHVTLDRKKYTTRDPKSRQEMSLVERYTHTAFGNADTLLDLGDSHTNQDDRYTKWDYQISASPYFVLPRHQRIYSVPEGPEGDKETHRESQASYDEQGKIRSYQERLIHGPSQDPRTLDEEWPMTTFEYGRYAELKKVTTPSEYEMEFKYDDITRSYIVETKDSLGQTSTQFPDLRFGKVSQQADVNGDYVSYEYDDYGRLTSVSGPFARAAGQETLRFEYGSFPSFPLWAKVTRWDPSMRRVQEQPQVVESSAFVDGLGRTLATRSQAHVNDDGVSWDGWITRGFTGYDVWDNPIRVYEPFFDPQRGGDDSAHPLTLLPGPGSYYREFDYDARGRKIRSSIKGQTHTFTYTLASIDGGMRELTTQTDPLGQTQLMYADARGQITSVIEHLGSGGAAQPVTSSYTYNPIGELVRVKDPAGNQSTARYDSRGDLIALETPDAGKTRYFYDLFGNRIAEQSAEHRLRNERVEFLYEGPRLVGIDAPGENDDVTYVYGTQASDKGPAGGNTFGRIKSEASSVGLRSYTYDGLGQIASVSAEVFGDFSDNAVIERAKVRYTHDDLGNLQSKVVEGVCNEHFEYIRDYGGWLQSLTSYLTSTDSGSCQDARVYVERAEYNVRGQASRIRYGNGLEAWYRYNDETQQLKEQYLLGPNGSPNEAVGSHRVFSAQAYDYDALGRLVTISPTEAKGINGLYPGFHVPKKTQTFKYDELSRLTASQGTLDPVAFGQERQNYEFSQSYDLLGNITSKTQRSWSGVDAATSSALAHQSYAQEYEYRGAKPRAVSHLRRSVSGVGRSYTRRFGYDESGRRVREREWGRTRRFAWTARGQLAAVTQRGQELSRSWYDGQGSRRVHRSLENGETSLVTYAADELTSVNGERTVHVYFGDERVASHQPRTSGHYGALSWFHQDYLGSTNFVSDKYASVHSQVEYFPSGEPWFEHRDPEYKLRAPSFLFTGKEYERSTGLYAFGFRHYDPVVGQWISPDPAMAEYFQTDLAGGVFEPRNLGTYAYAWNNPVGAKDPDGRFVQPLIQMMPRLVSSAQRAAPVVSRWFNRGAKRAARQWKRLSSSAKRIAKSVSAEVGQGWATREASGEEHTAKAVAEDVVAGVLGGVGGARASASGKSPFGPTKRRVKLRKGVKDEIRKNQPRNSRGEMIDPNTKEVLDESSVDIGHKPGNEWRRRKRMHEEKGSSRGEVIESENNPNLYHLEDRASNRSHRFEKE